MKSSDPFLQYYSKRRLGKVVNYLVSFGSAAILLLAPSFLLVKLQISQTLKLTITLGFVCLFTLGMAVFTNFKTADIVLRTSEYCAVLVVLVGLL
jgi:hypothetical protein